MDGSIRGVESRNVVIIERAGPKHLAEIAALAELVWRAHYPGIITPEQISYMLRQMYDLQVLRQELREGVVYFRASVEGEFAGFASVGPGASAKEYKLHKLYVSPDRHRQGIGRALIQAAENVARGHGASTLILNVNKRNQTAISAYLRHGFAVRESVVVDIGGGFVMDDYIMAKSAV